MLLIHVLIIVPIDNRPARVPSHVSTKEGVLQQPTASVGCHVDLRPFPPIILSWAILRVMQLSSHYPSCFLLLVRLRYIYRHRVNLIAQHSSPCSLLVVVSLHVTMVGDCHSVVGLKERLSCRELHRWPEKRTFCT